MTMRNKYKWPTYAKMFNPVSYQTWALKAGTVSCHTGAHVWTHTAHTHRVTATQGVAATRRTGHFQCCWEYVATHLSCAVLGDGRGTALGTLTRAPVTHSSTLLLRRAHITQTCTNTHKKAFHAVFIAALPVRSRAWKHPNSSCELGRTCRWWLLPDRRVPPGGLQGGSTSDVDLSPKSTSTERS